MRKQRKSVKEWKMHLGKLFMGFVVAMIVVFTSVAPAGSFNTASTTIRGEYLCVPNFCFSDPCLPGMMWAVKHDDTVYYLIHEMYGRLWDCSKTSWDGYRPKEGSTVVVVGEVLEAQDIWGNTYYSIDVEHLLPGICPVEEVYGESANETTLLRYFRENVLSQTPEGRELIKLYYQWSPVIVKAMKEDEGFKKEIKEMIDGVLGLVVGE
jgi:hypothetical protein